MNVVGLAAFVVGLLLAMRGLWEIEWDEALMLGGGMLLMDIGWAAL